MQGDAVHDQQKENSTHKLFPIVSILNYSISTSHLE